jgi:hypothetical protein
MRLRHAGLRRRSRAGSIRIAGRRGRRRSARGDCTGLRGSHRIMGSGGRFHARKNVGSGPALIRQGAGRRLCADARHALNYMAVLSGSDRRRTGRQGRQICRQEYPRLKFLQTELTLFLNGRHEIKGLKTHLSLWEMVGWVKSRKQTF